MHLQQTSGYCSSFIFYSTVSWSNDVSLTAAAAASNSGPLHHLESVLNLLAIQEIVVYSIVQNSNRDVLVFNLAGVLLSSLLVQMTHIELLVLMQLGILEPEYAFLNTLRIQLKMLEEEVQAVCKGLEKVKHGFKVSGSDGPVNFISTPHKVHCPLMSRSRFIALSYPRLHFVRPSTCAVHVHTWQNSCTCCFDVKKHIRPVFQKEPNRFTCSDIECACTDVTLRCRLRLLGRDGTGEGEFCMMGRIAWDFIGVLVREVKFNNYQGHANCQPSCCSFSDCTRCLSWPLSSMLPIGSL